MSRIFASTRRPRAQTDVDFVKSALSDARQCCRRADDALPYDAAFTGEDATEEQALADGVDSNDIAEARVAEADARTRARHLDASAPSFDHLFAPDEEHSVRRAAQDLVDAAVRLHVRILDFEPFAIEADADGAMEGEEELTLEEEQLLANPPVLFEVPREPGAAGAPRWDVSEEDRERLWVMFVDWRWTQARIARVLGCSARKLRSLFSEHGIARPQADIARINEVIREHMRAGASGVGIRKICGALRAAGVPFSWHTVAEALAALDPVGRDQRYRNRVPRVHYNVRNANGMWHIDGYEHLVSWNIYIEGAIDGGTRKVLFLNAVDNKFARTMASFVMGAIATHGVPRKLRMDCGTENVDMARFAALLREAGYRIADIRGPSTRNQRIERYWGDLNPYISPIAIALQDLERRGVLQFWVDLHHAALHLVVLPYVNRVCERAMDAWNSHYVATADMKCSPDRKFALSMAAQVRQDRWQALVTDDDGFVQLSPARKRAIEARGEIAGPYVPQEGFAWIDQFSASVIRDADRVRTWRRPVSEPALREAERHLRLHRCFSLLHAQRTALRASTRLPLPAR